MRIGAFELSEPVPELQEPHALAMLRPWVDAGGVGTLTLTWLEAQLGARQVGSLIRPGSFFDFTRYRPSIYLHEGRRKLAVPNSTVTFARSKERDFIFLHLLEPHMMAELFVDSVVKLLRHFGVKRYCLLGSMYDMVPHTRPLIISARGTGEGVAADLQKAGAESSDYEGPTTITYLITERAGDSGIESMSLIVHLPQYTELDEDYSGKASLVEALGRIYSLPPDEADQDKAEQQRDYINSAIEQNAQIKAVITELEARYDARVARKPKGPTPELSPEVEKFLREMEKRFGQG